ncbi:MAG: adhesin, partial [Moraxellaceae bacterium]|nr:adhesin [Moraxellaceae bacterium]
YAGATSYSSDYSEYVDAGIGSRATAGGGMPPTGVNMTDAEYALVAAWTSQRSGATAPPRWLAPTATTSSASSVSKYGATLNGSVNDNGADATYQFNYGTTTGYGTSVTGLTTSGTGGGVSNTSISTTIGSLSCGTTYHFRVRGTNSQGTTNGSDSSFSTSACPAVTSLTGSTTLTEDQSFSITVNTTGSPSSLTLSGAPSGMTISGSTISWPAASTPDSPTSNTVYNFTIVASDGTTTNNYNTSVTVTPVNDPPVISTTAGTSASEGVAYSYDVNASDTEGSTLTYSLTTKPASMTINSSTGVISWTPPDATANYSESVTVQVSDGSQTDTESWTINVTANNDSPSITSTAVTSGSESVAYSYDVNATDPEAQTLTYSLVSPPSGMTINSGTGVISWTPPEALTGYSQGVSVNVSDGTNTANQAYTITVTANNDAPSISSVAVTSAAENVAYSYDVNATDPESQTLTYSLTANPSGMTINGSTGVISWTPPQAGSTYTENVTVQVTDGTNPVTQSFTITVTSSNDPPTFTSTDNTAATEGVAYSNDVNGSDPEGGSLTYSLTSSPAGMTIDAATGVIGWTPPQALSNYTQGVTVQISDGTNNVSRSYTINVSADNDAPSFTSTDVTSVVEDNAYSYDVNGSDPEGQTLTFGLTANPSGMTINGSTGVISWTPPLNSNASQNVTMTVSDGTNTVSRSFTITITPQNDAPTIVSTAVTSVTEDTAYSYDVNGADVDGDTLTYSLVSPPSGMTINSSTGVISWTPPLNSNASVSVNVSVSDGSLSGSQSFTLTVTPVNDTPALAAIAASMQDDGSGTFSYDVNASDVDSGDTLYYSLTTAPSGMIINSSTGVISWTVPTTVSNPYNVTVAVRDRADPLDAAVLTDAASFTITVQDNDGDGYSEYFDNCPSVSNSDQTNTDVSVNAPGDALGDACDTDDDNDQIPDTVEVANGLDPLDDSDASEDLNGNGQTNLEDYQACSSDADCYSIGSPVITTNGDKVVDATGYFTPVEVTATAQGVGGPLAVSADNRGPFRPGSNVVTWTAGYTAADGSYQTTSVEQKVTVKPQATLGGSQVIGQAITLHIPVRLNGDTPAPQSDVTLSYSVGGTAVAGTDFVALPGTVTLAGGIRQATIDVTVNAPSVTTNRTLVLTLTGVSAGDAVLGDAAQREYTITLSGAPAAPAVTLRSLQGVPYRQVVYQDAGTVTLEATVFDPNGDTVTPSWLPGGLPLVVSGNTATFDPSAVALGSYEVTFTATDSTGLATTRTLAITVLNAEPVLTTDDTDGDSVTDDLEGAVDANGNGLLDYLDVNTGAAPESIQLSLNSDSLLTMAVTDSGLTLAAGGHAVSAQSATTLQAGIQVFETQITNSAGTPVIDEDYAAVGAIYDFEVRGLTSASNVAHVVLPQTAVLLPNARWRGLNSNGLWQNFVTPTGAVVSAAFVGSTEVDSISSAPRDEATGQCPPPQSDAYVPGLVAGYVCVQLAVADGGPNDADGQVNGSVQVTGAATVARDEATAVAPEESQSGGSTDLYTLMLLALATLLIRRKEPIR